MPIRHSVSEGEGLSSLALAYGLSPQRIWDDPANSELRKTRPDPNILLPGDVVIIPDRAPKQVPAVTGRRHVFRRIGVPARFRMQFLAEDGKPRAGVPWSLIINARSWAGTTDADGRLDIFVPNDARQGVLVLGDGEEELEIDFGGMDPLDTPSGLRKRLANLGFGVAGEEGEIGPKTTAALRRFQRLAGLTETGEADAATLAKLQELHDTSATW